MDADHSQRSGARQHDDCFLGRRWNYVGKAGGNCLYSPAEIYTRTGRGPGYIYTEFLRRREKKDAMGYLGKVSGRDEADKITAAGLRVTEIDGAPSFEEASLVLVCKKRYVQEMKEECFVGNEEIERWYPNKDYHVMYMAEIVDAYVPEGE